MCLKKITVCVIVAFGIIEVRSQVCTRKVQTSIEKTYSYVIPEKLCDNCDSRNIEKIASKVVPIIVDDVECCHGYTKLDQHLEASSTNCVKGDKTRHVSECSETCRNGKCSKTNECICFESYEEYPPGSNKCIDKCDSGYERMNGVCQPRCTKPCHGGFCASPDDCNCYTGWEKNKQGECIPTCNPGCGNGTCVDLNKCSCPNGYELRENANPQCVLKCYSGYERINGVCQPRCTKPCHGGYCAGPEECLCRTGWEKNKQGKCIPTCNPGCGNGTCVNLNKCSCPNGYELRENANPQCVTTAITSESTTTKYTKAYERSPIPTKSTPRSRDVKKYKGFAEHHESPIQEDSNGSKTLLYAAVGANIVMLTIIISIILYKNPGIYKRFQKSSCTKKTTNDGQVLYYDYVQLPLPIRIQEENVYSN